jgi:hypothetical protein
MRAVHSALIEAGEGWLTINELVDKLYPGYGTWRERERRRFAVRKAVAALERDQPQGHLQGVRVVHEGAESDERVRADLTSWTGRRLETPKPRDRRPRPASEPERVRGACRHCGCLSFDGSGPGKCAYCGHAYSYHAPAGVPG